MFGVLERKKRSPKTNYLTKLGLASVQVTLIENGTKMRFVRTISILMTVYGCSQLVLNELFPDLNGSKKAAVYGATLIASLRTLLQRLRTFYSLDVEITPAQTSQPLAGASLTLGPRGGRRRSTFKWGASSRG